ncbi:hypothetical protein V2G26_019304 [Clonostachys chloroleuca]
MARTLTVILQCVALATAQLLPQSSSTSISLSTLQVSVPPTTSPGEPPPTIIVTNIKPTATGDPGQGAICECGYTYCSSVLMAMKVPWNEEQLKQAYCTTEDAVCDNGTPSSDIKSALFLCLCDTIDQKVGNNLHLVCGCNTCLNIGPDYRGRCKTPCVSGQCKERVDATEDEYDW